MREVRVAVLYCEYKVLVKFKDEGGVTALSPITLTRDLESKVGEVVSAEGLRDGSLVCFNVNSMRRRSNSSRYVNV